MRFCTLCFLSKGQLEQVQLSAPSVVLKNKAVNFTTALRPSNVGTVTYFWWFDNKTEVSSFYHSVPFTDTDDGERCIHSCHVSAFKALVTLDGTNSFTFSKEGSHTVTVQASAGNTVQQDQITVAVYGVYCSLKVGQ